MSNRLAYKMIFFFGFALLNGKVAADYYGEDGWSLRWIDSSPFLYLDVRNQVAYETIIVKGQDGHSTRLVRIFENKRVFRNTDITDMVNTHATASL